MQASHPLAAGSCVSTDALGDQRLVMFPRERASALYDHILEQLGGASRFRSVHHITTIGPGVAADMMGALDDESVAPSPRWCSLEQAPHGLVCLPLVPHLPVALWLVWTGIATRPTRALARFARRIAAEKARGERSTLGASTESASTEDGRSSGGNVAPDHRS